MKQIAPASFRSWNDWARMIAILALATTTLGIHAQPANDPVAFFDYELGVTHEAHSNQGRVDGGSADFQVAPFARIQFDYHSPQADLTVRGFSEYVTYLRNTLSDEFQNKLSMDGEVRLIRDRLHWSLNENLDLFAVDPTGAQNQDNQQELNVFSTGPDLFLVNSSRHRATLSARLLDFRSETDDADNRQASGVLDLARKLTPHREIGGVLSQSDVEFDGELSADDFTRSDRAVNFVEERPSSSATDTFRLLYGETEIDFADPTRETASSPLISASWRRNWAEKQHLRIAVRQELSDISREVQSASAVGVGESALSIAVVRDPFERDRFDAEGYRRWASSDLRLQLYYDDIEYLSLEGIDQRYFGSRGEYRRPLLPGIDFRGVAELTRRQFEEGDQEDDILYVSGGVEYFRTRHWTWTGVVSWYDRRSNIAELSGQDLAISIGLSFSR